MTHGPPRQNIDEQAAPTTGLFGTRHGSSGVQGFFAVALATNRCRGEADFQCARRWAATAADGQDFLRPVLRHGGRPLWRLVEGHGGAGTDLRAPLRSLAALSPLRSKDCGLFGGNDNNRVAAGLAGFAFAAFSASGTRRAGSTRRAGNCDGRTC